MSINDTITCAFASINAAFATVSITATTEAGVTFPVTCPTIGLQRQNSEFGLSDMPVCDLFVDAVSLPAVGVDGGNVLTVNNSDGKQYRFRIGVVTKTASFVTLTMVSENG